MLHHRLKLIAPFFCAVMLLALCACSSNSVDYTKQAKEDAESLQDVTLGITTFKVPAAWNKSVDSTDDSAIYYAPWGTGFINLSMSSANTFPDDTEKWVKETLFAGSDDMTFENIEVGNRGFAESYTADVSRTADGEKYQGKVYVILSGTSSYHYFIILPEDAYPSYESLIPELFSSIDGMSLMMAPITESNAASKNSSTSESSNASNADTGTNTNGTSASGDAQATKSYGEGTYKVGTDMPAGEYKVTCTGSSRGYWKVTESSEVGARIVANDSFTGSSYVTLSDGQYIKFERCSAEPVQ